jgi:AraC family transcriptional regulator
MSPQRRDFQPPDVQSTFDERSGQVNAGFILSHTVTSPGSNASLAEHHCLALHLGVPVSIWHRRDRHEDLRLYRRDDCIFVPSVSIIDYAHAQPVDALYIYIAPGRFARLIESLDIDSSALRLEDHYGFVYPALAHLGHAIVQEMEKPAVGSSLYIDALVAQTEIQLIRALSTTPLTIREPDRTSGTARSLANAIDYIHTHLSDDLTLAAIASAAHLSPYHFSRLFRQTYGISPYQYVIAQRVQKAVELLDTTRLTVSEIAVRVGFADHSHLIRHYKRLMGVTPRR